MAKKIDYTLDEFGFDSSLDDFNFDFDSKPIKDDRKPSTKVVTGIGKGIKSTVRSEPFIVNTIKNILPKGYGSVTDNLIDTRDSIRDLYNSAAQEIKPVSEDLKRLTNKVLPSYRKYLPDSLSKRLENWASDADPGFKSYSYQSQDESEIERNLAEIFAIQAQENEKKDAAQEIREQMREGLSISKHREQLGQLNQMRISLDQLATYQNKITANYQRKSLELQYRQFFLAKEAFIEQKSFYNDAKAYLESINKNSALPDYVKLQQSERVGEALRNRFINSAIDNVVGGRGDFLKGFGSRLRKNITGSLSATMQGFRSGISGASGIMDEAQMAREMGAGVDSYDTAGQFIGSAAASMAAGSRWGNRLRERLGRNERVSSIGNRLQYHSSNLPQYADRFARSSWGSFGLGSFIVNPIKDAILQGRQGRHVDVDNVRNLNSPGVFTRQTNKTINEIIPSYLSKIHHELMIIRTGDASVEPQVYDFVRNRFNKESVAKSNIVNTLINPMQKEQVTKDIDNLINKIDPNGTLSPEARRALGTQLLEDNMGNRSGTPDRLTNSFVYRGNAEKYASQYANLFSNYFSDDKNYSKRAEFSQSFNDLGRFLSVDKSYIQTLINSGQASALADAGILSLGGPDTRDPVGFIDYNKYYSYHFKDSFRSSPQGPVGNVMPNAFKTPNDETPISQLHEQLSSSTPTFVDTNVIKEAINPVVQAIHSINPLSLLQLMQANLASIDTKLSAGVITLSAGNVSQESVAKIVSENKKQQENIYKEVQTSSTMRENANNDNNVSGRNFLKSPVRSLFRGAEYVTRKSLNGIYRTTATVGKAIGDELSMIARVSGKTAASVGGFGINLLRDTENVYSPNEKTPFIENSKLKAGVYVDSVTNKPVKKLADIKNDLINTETGETISLEKIQNGNVVTKNGLRPFRLVTSTFRVGGRVADSILGEVAGSLGKAAKAGGIGLGALFKQRTWADGEEGSIAGKTAKGLGSAAFSGAKLLGKAGGWLTGGITDALGSFTKLAGMVFEPIFRGRRIVSRLTDIYRLLDDRLPGKKIRKGSYEDQLQKEKAEDEKEAREQGIASGLGSSWSNSIYGMGASALANLFGRNKRRDSDGDDGESSSSGMLETAAWSAAGGWLAGKLGGAWGMAKNLGGKALRKLPGIAGLGFAGKELYDTTFGGEDFGWGSAATIGGGLLMSGVGRSALMGAGRMALGGLAGLAATVGLPVLLTAGAAVGGSYLIYRHFSKKKPELLSSVRYAQYGFTDNDDRFRTILEFEEMCTEMTIIDGSGRAKMDSAKFQKKSKEIAELFGVDPRNQAQISNWGNWFVNRFRPVFFNHLVELRNINKEVKLADVDEKLELEQKLAYLNKTALPNGPYDKMVSPFPELKSLQASASTVSELVSKARDELQEEKEDSEKPGFFSGLFGLGNKNKTTDETVDGDKKDTKSTLETVNNLISEKLNPYSLLGTPNALLRAIRYTGSSILEFLNPKIGNLTKLRMIQYGINPENTEDVKRVLILDKIAPKHVKFERWAPKFDITDKKELQTVYEAFGVDPNNEKESSDLKYWIQHRYARILLAHLRAFKDANKPFDLINVDSNLSKSEALKFLDLAAPDWMEYPLISSPFPGGKTIEYDREDVTDFVTGIRKEMTGDGEKKSPVENKSFFDKVTSFFGFGDKKKETDTKVSSTNTPVKPVTAGNNNALLSGTSAASLSTTDAIRAFDSGARDIMPGPGGVRVLRGDGASNMKLMLNVAKEMGVTDPKELAMLMSQLDHESAGFSRLEENLNYSPARLLQVFGKYFKTPQQAQEAAAGGPQAIANIVYGGRMGNRGPNDGWNYRGRGFIQLTGKDNYTRASKALGIDLVNNPDLASTPEIAAKIAVWYWKDRNGLSNAGKAGDVNQATKLINGGLNGLQHRSELYSKYLSMVQKGELGSEDSTGTNVGDSSTTAKGLGSEDPNVVINPLLGGPGSVTKAPVTTNVSTGGYAGSTAASVPVQQDSESTGSVYTGVNPNIVTPTKDVVLQQKENAASMPSSIDISTDLKEGNKLTKSILDVNMKSHEVLVSIAKLLTDINGKNNKDTSVVQTPTRNTSITDAPVQLKKRYAS